MRDPNCLFCKIVAGELPAAILDEDERTITFMDINPATRGHALVIPRRHARDLLEIEPDELAAVAVAAQRLAARVPEPPPGLFSNCLVVGDTVHVSGQHAGRPGGGLLGDGSVRDQTRQSLRKIMALVEAAGGHAADILKLTVYLTEMDRKGEVSEAWREFFGEPLLCSTLIGVNALVAPELSVEIGAIAVLGCGARQEASA